MTMQPYALSADNADATREIGFRLGQLLTHGDVVLLHGDLGAGKTTFVQGVAQGAGVAENLTSPTFTLIAEHLAQPESEHPMPLYHLDLYRLESDEEIDSIGLDDLLVSERGIVVIEWPERSRDLALQNAVLVELRFDGGSRRVLSISPLGTSARPRELIKALSKSCRAGG